MSAADSERCETLMSEIAEKVGADHFRNGILVRETKSFFGQIQVLPDPSSVVVVANAAAAYGRNLVDSKSLRVPHQSSTTKFYSSTFWDFSI